MLILDDQKKLTAMSDSKILIVEGVDDAHAVRNICYENGVSICIHDDRYDGDIQVYSAGGKNKIGAAIEPRLKLSHLSHLGVIVDADGQGVDGSQGVAQPSSDAVASAFQAVVRHLSSYSDWSYADVENDLTSEGWIEHARLITGERVRVGAWVMPDNESTGALEDFAAQLVPGGDPQWEYARHVIEALDEPRFKASHHGKARMHTYLAWQNPPREPIGRSISKGVLKTQSPLAQRFVAWVETLFNVRI